jgi:hypothetical protein
MSPSTLGGRLVNTWTSSLLFDMDDFFWCWELFFLLLVVSGRRRPIDESRLLQGLTDLLGLIIRVLALLAESLLILSFIL